MKGQVKINKDIVFPFAAKSLLVHAQVCDCTHNQDARKHVRSRVKAQASLAMIPQYHGPLATAYLLGGQYQLQQSSETRMCMPELCRCASQPYGGSSIGM